MGVDRSAYGRHSVSLALPFLRQAGRASSSSHRQAPSSACARAISPTRRPTAEGFIDTSLTLAQCHLRWARARGGLAPRGEGAG
jgi:hypothetical protein